MSTAEWIYKALSNWLTCIFKSQSLCGIDNFVEPYKICKEIKIMKYTHINITAKTKSIGLSRMFS